MNDLSQYMGLAQFGRAYQYMIQNDTHAPGSVDRLLTEQMVRLCLETADYLYNGRTGPARRPALASR